MGKYLRKKIFFYLITFFIAMTINWIVPRLMPGDPIKSMLKHFKGNEAALEKIYAYYEKNYGLDDPYPVQYFKFWSSLFRGKLGYSLRQSTKTVSSILWEGIPYSLMVSIPALLGSWFLGNWFGAYAARKKYLDSGGLPVMYIITAIPFMWFGMILGYYFGFVLGWFPPSGAYNVHRFLKPEFSLPFIVDCIYHWFLPAFSLFVIWLGGWAIGMRNMIIYELEANYSRYMECLGASDSLIRKYAFQNAILPQVTGLGIQLGLVVTGNIVIEIVFSYRGIGYTLLNAVKNKDFFVVQGGFIFLIMGVLAANFIIDFIYIFIDPRIRYAYSGGK